MASEKENNIIEYTINNYRKNISKMIVDLNTQVIDEKDTIKLFHGTSTYYLNDILLNGILPRKETSISNWSNIPSFEELTYLTNKWHYAYAINSVIELQKTKGISSYPCYIEVEIPKGKLVVDEDFINSKYIIEKIKTIVEKNQPKLEIASSWEECLRYYSTVSCLGKIGRKYIKSFTVIGDPNFIRKIMKPNSEYMKDFNKCLSGKGKGKRIKLIDLLKLESNSNRNATWFLNNLPPLINIGKIEYNSKRNKTELHFENLLSNHNKIQIIDDTLSSLLQTLI